MPTKDQTSSPATEPRATSVLVPQHSYNMELESGENPFATHFGTLSDADWLALLKRSLTEPEIEGIDFPRFPEDELQSRIHGNAGESAIEEAFNFYRFCRDSTYGTPAGGEQRRLLDFGAGWGRMTRAFMRDFAASGLYGYEPNLLFSTLARSLNPYVCYMTGPQLPDRSLPPGWFDLVVGYSVFSHLPERSAGAWLAEINRSLRPGGWCVLTTWGRRLLDLLTEQKQRLEAGEEIHWYHETLLSRIGDIPARAREFDAGEFIFLGEDDALYGDTLLSEAALRRVLEAEGLDFELLRFDVSTLPQDAFVLQRPS